tara:strand:+ start:1499 stop:1891 length:393 start_codon:yes stop_codon:yes gene_type:complete
MYYTVEQLNNPAKNQDTRKTRKYYYERLKRLKEERKMIKCPDYYYTEIGFKPRIRTATSTGYRCKIAVKYDDNKYPYRKRDNNTTILKSTLTKKRNNNKKEKDKKDKNKKELIKEITITKLKKPIKMSFT